MYSCSSASRNILLGILVDLHVVVLDGAARRAAPACIRRRRAVAPCISIALRIDRTHVRAPGTHRRTAIQIPLHYSGVGSVLASDVVGDVRICGSRSRDSSAAPGLACARECLLPCTAPWFKIVRIKICVTRRVCSRMRKA